MAAKTFESQPRRVSNLTLLRYRILDSAVVGMVHMVRRVRSFKPFVETFDTLGKNGLPQAVGDLFGMLGAQAPSLWEGDREHTQSVLTHSPFLLVHNHPCYTEPLAVLANMPNRMSVKTMGNGILLSSIAPKHAKPHIIHVIPPTPWESKERKVARQVSNEQTMMQASKGLREDGLGIMLAPEGGLQTHWRVGIAKLAEGVLGRDDVYFVMTHVEGKRAMIKELFMRRGFRRPVHFSEAIPFSSLPIPDEVKALPQGDSKKLATITAILESYYNQWAGKYTNR